MADSMMRVFYGLLFCCWSIPALAQTAGPKVSSVFPESQTITAQRSSAIEILFDEPINPASITPKSVFVFGRWSGTASGQLEVAEDNTIVRFLSDKPFMAGEWVTVSLSKNIEGFDDSLMDNGYIWSFWIESAPGTFDYTLIDDISTRESGEGLVRSYGAYAGDLNRDGYSDLMIPNEVANDIRVFLNDGLGGYSDFATYSIPNGAVPSTNEGADFNLDGWIDFAIGNTGNDLVSVWSSSTNGVAVHTGNVEADNNIRGLCMIDLNGDNAMDMVTANRTGQDDNGNVSVLMNDGTGAFSRTENMETNSAGETACATIDANHDGIQDVFIGTYTGNEVLLYLGDGVGGLSFSDKKTVGANPWMLAAGDMNGDGHADVVSSNTGDASVSVVLGNGDGSLRNPVEYSTGQFPLAIDVGDLDGDGDLDVVTSNFSSNDYTVLENNGLSGLSRKLTLPATRAASCTILHDRDNDGDLDITAIDELADRIFLYDNITEATSVEEVGLVNAHLKVTHVFPNPSSTSSTIKIWSTNAEEGQMMIYDILGRVITQRNVFFSIGSNELVWDGYSDDGNKVKPGIYFLELQSSIGNFQSSIMRQ